jgi:hypothetical protein
LCKPVYYVFLPVILVNVFIHVKRK